MSEKEVNAKKEQSPKPMVEILQATFDEAVHRALFDQSGVLMSTLQDVIKKIVPKLVAQRNQLGGQIGEQLQHHQQQQYRLGGQAYQ
jgi:hypothetical protein